MYIYVYICTCPFLGLHTFERLPGTYLVMGLDFMVTADYHVWFIEANNYPLWPSNVPKLDKYTYAMAVRIYKPYHLHNFIISVIFRMTCLIW